MTDTDALIELLGKATPGPWEVCTHGTGLGFGVLQDFSVGTAQLASNKSEHDARLIAIAPDLAREVIALRAEIARVSSAMDSVMVGGNHLANVLIGNLGAGFAERFPPDMDHELALRSLCATDNYEVWCCWRSIMNARDILTPNH